MIIKKKPTANMVNGEPRTMTSQGVCPRADGERGRVFRRIWGVVRAGLGIINYLTATVTSARDCGWGGVGWGEGGKGEGWG